MDTISLIAALAFVGIWAARSAKAKGRNPWLWGGASFVLGIPPIGVHLFAVVPLIILMFLKSPQQHADSIVLTTTCPKCQSKSARSSRFCTTCGWELARVNTLDTPQEVEQPTGAASTETQEPPEVVQTPAQGNAQPAEVSDESTPAPVTDQSPQSETAQSASAETVTAEPVTAETEASEPAGEQTDAEPASEDASEETPAPVTAYRTPVPVAAPTAAAMTERGVRLFNQGRTQEAIDQFTKAIALDANFVEAWAKRAEAYALLGRGDQAAEDQRRLDSLNASSS